MKNNIKYYILLVTILLSATAHSQEQIDLEKNRQQQSLAAGTIIGKITDEKSGEDLIGANVFIVDTKLGASTDIEGKYQIKKIPEGTYNIRISFLGYETKVISGVVLKYGEQIVINASIGEDQGIQQQEVVISATAIKSGEGAILAERKKASGIGDGISSEQMKKAPDANSGDALKRVTGVTLVDNKFIFVRGVTDRYNQTTLNGASVTSTSVDKKSFSFDMLPSNLLENMNIAKTATPDLPGDFTGGLVQLNTLDVPETRAIKLVMSGGYNSITTHQPFNRTQGGGKDWLGYDDGKRSFPDEVQSASQIGSLGTKLPNTWAPRNTKAPLAQSMSISIADRYDIDEDQLGIVAAYSYRNNFQRTNFNFNDIGSTFTQSVLHKKYSGTQDRYSILWGGILDLSYKFADLHKITIKNNYNKTAEDKYIRTKGIDIDNDQYVQSYLSEWEERGMFSSQLGGEHKLPELFNTNIDWMFFFSEANTDQPDRKQVDYNLSTGYPDTDPFTVSTQPEYTKRAWASLYDRSLGEKLNITIPVDDAKIKLGILNEVKNRHYDIRYYSISPLSSNFELGQYGIDSVFAQNNFGGNKFNYFDYTNPSDKYSAKQESFAAYTMLDLPFSIAEINFRFAGGVRMEHSIQNVFTNGNFSSIEPVVSTIAKRDFLPSINFSYIIDEMQNLRIAYSQTVNRPEFRELAGVQFYDFNKYEYVVGNLNLTRALARNYDIRYEIFPETGDLLAVSYFYKNISHPIEEFRIVNSATYRSWKNADKAKNFGWEFEIRKNFGFVAEYFRNIQLVANYTRIFSEVPYRENSGSTGVVEGIRQMQGQSPYTYNVSLFFVEPNIGTSINVLYNEYGSRIDAIGNAGVGDLNVIEYQRGTVDFSLTQPLSILIEGFEAKYTVKNLNNQPTIYTHGTEVYRFNITGITHSLQFSFNF